VSREDGLAVFDRLHSKGYDDSLLAPLADHVGFGTTVERDLGDVFFLDRHLLPRGLARICPDICPGACRENERSNPG
jgi:hypothetical protein